MLQKPTILVVVGPTASGKSELGVVLAKMFDGEIISADSRQVYKGLDIGSGKVPKDKKKRGGYYYKGIRHYCIDIENPKKVFTAVRYALCARRAIKDIQSQNKIPIIVGGTGFYIDAALGKINFTNVKTNLQLRKRLQKKSPETLFLLLKHLDPKRATSIDRHNQRRLIRAVEIAYAQNKNYRANKKNDVSKEDVITTNARIIWIGIKRSNKDLKKRIHQRLIDRFDGIVKEVRQLHKQGVSWKRLYDLGLEYRYVSLFVRSIKNHHIGTRYNDVYLKQKYIELLETKIRQYVKHQMTWWKKNNEILWVEFLTEQA